MQTKENEVEHHTQPTVSGGRVPEGLDEVRRMAHAREQERFSALLHHLTIDLLRESYFALKRSAARAVDGVNWQEYEHNLEERLASLHERVHWGTYRAQLREECIYRKPTDGNVR